jgi:hypothetical protein
VERQHAPAETNQSSDNLVQETTHDLRGSRGREQSAIRVQRGGELKMADHRKARKPRKMKAWSTYVTTHHVHAWMLFLTLSFSISLQQALRYPHGGHSDHAKWHAGHEQVARIAPHADGKCI